MRLFVDTSVLLGFFDGGDDFEPTATRLQAMHALGDAELWVSAQSYVDVHRILRSAYSDAEILTAFNASLDLFKVSALDGSDMADAFRLAEQDFDDCLVDIAAQKVKADILLTTRERGYEDAKTLVMTPEEFFEELAASGVTYEGL